VCLRPPAKRDSTIAVVFTNWAPPNWWLEKETFEIKCHVLFVPHITKRHDIRTPFSVNSCSTGMHSPSYERHFDTVTYNWLWRKISYDLGWSSRHLATTWYMNSCCSARVPCSCLRTSYLTATYLPWRKLALSTQCLIENSFSHYPLALNSRMVLTCPLPCGSRDSSARIGCMAGARFLVGERDFPPIHSIQTGSDAHPASYLVALSSGLLLILYWFCFKKFFHFGLYVLQCLLSALPYRIHAAQSEPT
jgi:hypothetical protein